MTARVACLVLACGCARIDSGLEIEVSAKTHGRAGPAAGLLVFSHVRLVSCAEVMAGLAPVSVAWAHGGEAPRAADPARADFERPLELAAGQATSLAVLKPAPGLCSGLDVGIAPAQADVQ